MKTIYRYTINKSINDIDIPNGAEIISVGVSKENDKEEISIWAIVDSGASMTKRRFLVFGTGADMDETTNFNLKFIGTVKKANQYAFHVFEIKDSIV